MNTPSTHAVPASGTSPHPIPLGTESGGDAFTLSAVELRHPMLVLGAHDSGKTTALRLLADGYLAAGWRVIVIDLAEDTGPDGLRDAVYAVAESRAVEYRELVTSDPNAEYGYELLQGLDVYGAVDVIMSLLSFEAPFYAAVAKRLLGQLTQLCLDAHAVAPEQFGPLTLRSVGALLAADSLAEVTAEMWAAVLASDLGRPDGAFGVLAAPTEPDQQTAHGLGARIAQLYASDAAVGALDAHTDRAPINLAGGGVRYLAVAARRGHAELARVLSSSVMRHLATQYAEVVSPTLRTALIVNDASQMSRQDSQILLARCRSAGIALVLATEGADEWNDEQGQDWERVVNNTNVNIVLRQPNQESAALCAQQLGGALDPATLYELAPGTAVVRASTPTQRREVLVELGS